MKKTRDYYDRRLLEMMDCKPESLAARQSAAFDCFVELMRENRFPDLRLQFHALLRVLQDLLRIQQKVHFLRYHQPDGRGR
jgi:hypothetical protein